VVVDRLRKWYRHGFLVFMVMRPTRFAQIGAWGINLRDSGRGRGGDILADSFGAQAQPNG